MAIKPSLRFALLLILLHMMAASVILASLMPMLDMLAMLILILISLFYHLARDALLLFPDSWSRISFNQGHLSIATRNGLCFSAGLTNKATVSPYFALLCVRREGRGLPVSRAIFPDALGDGEFRELCVLLKFSRKPP